MNLNLNRNYKFIPFLVFFVVLLLIHWKIQPFVFDDATIRNVLLSTPLVSFDSNNFLVSRYFTWSSRTLIELNWGIFLLLPSKIWKVIDSVIIVLIPFLLVKLTVLENKFSSKKHLLINSFACILTLVFLVGYYFTLNPGWISGTINYIWPIFFALVHFYILKDYIFLKRNLTTINKILVYFVLILSLFEAVSNEQLMLIILAIYLFIILTCLYKKIKIKKIAFINLILIILNGIYIFVAPGNHARTVYSIKVILPSFASFSLIDKFYAGFSLFFNQILVVFDIPTLVFFTIFAVFTYLVTKKKISFIAFVPLLFKIVLLSSTLFSPKIMEYYSASGDLIGMFAIDPLRFAVIWISFIIIVFSIIFSLYLIYKYYNKKISVFMAVFLLIATGSGIIGGFTPTGTSGARIYLFYYLITVLLSLVMCIDLIRSKT